jgi:hypothetical protein
MGRSLPAEEPASETSDHEGTAAQEERAEDHEEEVASPECHPGVDLRGKDFVRVVEHRQGIEDPVLRVVRGAADLRGELLDLARLRREPDDRQVDGGRPVFA